MATASGFLDSENVVFYHPLDSYVDGVQDDTWAGSASFGTGIISSGLNSATLDPPSVSSGLSQPDIVDKGVWVVPYSDISNKALLVHWSTAGSPDGMSARVVTVSGDNSISVGAKSILTESSQTINRGEKQFVHISGNRFAGIFARGNGWYIDVATFDVDGDTVTWNDKTTITGQSSEFYSAGYSLSIDAVPGATSGGFIVSYYENIAFPDESGIYMKYCQIDGDGGVVLGDKVVVDGSGYRGRLAVLNPNQAILTYCNRADDTKQMMKIINISGTTLTTEEGRYSENNYNTYTQHVRKIDESGFLTTKMSTDVVSALLTTYRISGGNIITMSSGTFDTDNDHVYQCDSFLPSGENDGCIIYHQSAYGIAGAFFNVDENFNVTPGSRVDYSTGGSPPAVQQISLAPISNGRYLSVGEDKKTLQIITRASNDIYSPSGSLYPAVSGASGIAMGCWVNTSTSSISSLSIERDCNINITSGNISFCSGSLYWNDAAIVNWIDSVSDDDNHLIFLDLRYQGGNNWKLYTSLDGSPWVDQGIQNSGSMGEITTDAAPRISFASSDSNQLLDEVIMWSGVEQFSDIELLRLYAMGSSYDLRMDEYDEDLGISISGTTDLYTLGFSAVSMSGVADLYTTARNVIQASGDLLVNGYIGENASGNLFINGYTETSGATGKPLDWLLKTPDHNPQIIGTLEGATSVNIQLWEITNGQNTSVSISSSGCYQIGQTGRWGWSTFYLPAYNAYRAQYFYVMTSNNDSIFTGQFFMEIPERAKWIHPDNLGDYLIQQ
jgi:hypothetical protein